MPDLSVAIIVHLLGVVWWIGGLAFVSTILLPQIRRDPENSMQLFRTFEHRFAPQVRIALILVGLSGAWMLYRLGLWRMFGQPAYWWLYAMIGLWALFTLMLFVFGPMGVLKRVMSGPMNSAVARRVKRMHQLHVVLLVIALITIAGAAAGGHGFGW